MKHMNDIELLGRLHQLRNHCDCANDLLTNGRRSGQDVTSAEAYAAQCASAFEVLFVESKGLPPGLLTAAIAAEVRAITRFAISFSLS